MNRFAWMGQIIYLEKKDFIEINQKKRVKIFRRSIFVTQNIKKGEKFNKYNIRRIRPGYGLPPIYYEKLLNKKISF